MSAILCFCSLTAGGHIIPVDGRMSTWNKDWKALQSTKLYPKGVELMTLLIYRPFTNVRMITICQDGENPVIAYMAQQPIEVFGKANNTEVKAKTCVIENAFAKKICSIWIRILRESHYSESTGKHFTMDGVRCYAGGTDPKNPYHFLMGQFSLDPSSSLEERLMVDMADGIVGLIESNKANEKKQIIQKVMLKINAVEDQKREMGR